MGIELGFLIWKLRGIQKKQNKILFSNIRSSPPTNILSKYSVKSPHKFTFLKLIKKINKFKIKTNPIKITKWQQSPVSKNTTKF